MHRTCARWHVSSKPDKNSGNNSLAMASEVTISPWSSPNCATALHAAWRHRGFVALSWARTALSISKIMASSSMNSTICDITARPATVCFQSPTWKRPAMTGFSVDMTTGKRSFWAMQRLRRSMTSLPLVKFSSSSAASSSSSSWALQPSMSSLSIRRNCTATSKVDCTKPGTLAMALGFPSAMETRASRASRCVSSSLCDFAMVLRIGTRVVPMASLKKSADCGVPCKA
mmetsp:Transcript_75127/g.210770  ORF Transcript_75127/g.210770 Transcript_75127/m.210770 type:complete len:230 (-) Transcript_75127:551-1240(-)